MKKIVRRILFILATPVILLVLIFGYLGFVPGVSALFGSDKPVDLGAAYSSADQEAANAKFGQKFVEVSKSIDPLTLMRAADTVPVSESFSAKQIAAHIEETHPVSDVQVVFHADGSFAASGRIDKSRITGFLKSLGIAEIDDTGILAAIDKYLPGNPPFYLEGSGSIASERVTLQLTQAKIGRLPFATDAFASGLTQYAEAVMKNVPHFDVEAIAIENEQLSFRGTAPAIVPKY